LNLGDVWLVFANSPNKQHAMIARCQVSAAAACTEHTDKQGNDP
jgi:hypothetical protein